MTKDAITVDEHEPTDASVVTEEAITDDDLTLYDSAEVLADLGSGKLSTFPTPDELVSGDGAPAGAGTVEKAADTSSSPAHPKFDIGTLPPDVRKVVMDATYDIRDSLSRMHGHYLNIGRRLLEVKAVLPHGSWIPYLKSFFEPEWGLTARTAQNWMAAAEVFAEDNPYGEALSISALVELAKASDDIRSEVLERVRDGEDVTVNAIKEFKRAAKQKASSASLTEPSERSNSDALPDRPPPPPMWTAIRGGIAARGRQVETEISDSYATLYRDLQDRLQEAGRRQEKNMENPFPKAWVTDLGGQAMQLKEMIEGHTLWDGMADNPGAAQWQDVLRVLGELYRQKINVAERAAPRIDVFIKAGSSLPAPADA